MSKLAIVKSFSDSEPQLQIVQSVRELQQTVASLPDAMAAEIARGLEPLQTLRQDVTRSLEAFDRVTAAQRAALDTLTQRMSAQAAEAFERKAAAVNSAITELSRSVSSLSSSISRMEQAARRVEGVPKALQEAQRRMLEASERLTEAAEATRPRLWRQALGLILAGVMGGLVVATGQSALERLLPPSDVQWKADWASAIWSKATEREKELIRQIASRPDR